VYFIIILYAFSWAKEFLLPIVLAATLSFLLAPAVSRLEKSGLHPVFAVLGVVAIAFAIIAMLCATLSVEALDLVNSLAKYRDNITAKWLAVQQGPPGPLNLAFRNIGELMGDLAKTTTAVAPGGPNPEPAKVQIVEGTAGIVALIRRGMTPMVGPVGGFIIVVVLVAFMLLEREQFRQRFLRLVGHSQVAVTTLAVDEAASKLARFLLTQALINSAYAVLIGIGLLAIGIPNALLWAVLTLVLRFLPYVGLWISAFFPLALSIAISTSWTQPILTLLLYVVLETFTNNVVEPILLGGSTGLSPLAIIISTLFWTWIWGPVGLLLATPITACLVVLGRYFPAFLPCCIMLAVEPPASAEKRLLHLLEKGRLSKAKSLMDQIGGAQLSIKTAEELIIPTVRIMEKDLPPGDSMNPTKTRIYRQMRRIIDELEVQVDSKIEIEHPQPAEPILAIVPFIREGDEIVGKILQRFLGAIGIQSRLFPGKALISEKIQQLKESKANIILLSATDAESTTAVGQMAESIHKALPQAVILVGLWSLPDSGSAQLMMQIRESAASEVYTNLNEAIQGIVSHLTSPAQDEELRRQIQQTKPF
jgi:predicted PurR-regulated permease PerM/methylmalonyl-CoA mutase cobalamin-binding subunit